MGIADMLSLKVPVGKVLLYMYMYNFYYICNVLLQSYKVIVYAYV